MSQAFQVVAGDAARRLGFDGHRHGATTAIDDDFFGWLRADRERLHQQVGVACATIDEMIATRSRNGEPVNESPSAASEPRERRMRAPRPSVQGLAAAL